jgi:hypothetical protein
MYSDLIEATIYFSPRLCRNLNFVFCFGRVFFISNNFYPDLVGINGTIGLKYFIGRKK